ncbi:hypothetical protein PQ478_08765 [Alkalihalophilus pseudofirmus]|nr:hypothetical protein [Alkalihalophilus pseudofirmus]WEG18561.1 hypothetical protein PQ478_08765 [Alkalihalophilus pseudofirmus]
MGYHIKWEEDGKQKDIYVDAWIERDVIVERLNDQGISHICEIK